MANITAQDVNKLRQKTGAGMMDCKKALVEAEGDFEKAIEILRKKGQKIAANRADRDSSEGAVIAKVNADKNKGVIVTVNCETDFVAKNESFVALANQIAKKALAFETKEELLASDFEGISVSEKLIEQTGVIGEKIEISTFKKLQAPFVGSYIHMGNRIASLVGLSVNNPNSEQVGEDVAMQVVAMNPVALNETQVNPEIVEKELEIAKDQLRQEGKPEDMLEKIAQGKLQRFFKDNTLVHQAFIKDSNKSIQQFVKEQINGEITGFERAQI